MGTRAALLAALLLLAPARAWASAPPAWSAATPELARAVKKGEPLVVHVTVPLCDNAQINCGGAALGRPGDLRTNLYWGAIFGAKRFFSRKGSGWDLVATDAGVKGVLERAVFRRREPGAAWGATAEVEVLVVLDAFHGAKIDDALASFHGRATRGSSVIFDDGGKRRTLSVSVAGWAGHNRLLDGTKLPPAPPEKERKPVPTFVLACYSESWFGPALEKAGAKPLVSTKALMAPEGYAIEALARALGRNEPRKEVRDATVRAYAKWQEIGWKTATSQFAA